ncbi:MAG: TIGR01777 family oxidoreductase [Planctomycetota bacterium]|jgi:uncharacterized protein (TIGR01777 family)
MNDINPVIAVTGASGLIGKRLSAYLDHLGCRMIHLVRRTPDPNTNQIPWNPDQGELNPAGLEGIDTVINLAGENIASSRWSTAQKQAILTSRTQSTQLISQTIAGLQLKPKVFISASAVGYYGNRNDQAITEQSPPGTGFLADVCQQWEQATQAARQAGIRVVNLRIGMVLAAEGGALKQMLTPFKLGLGGVIGSGKQYISWIAIDDLVRIIEFLISADDIYGPVNAVTSHPVTNTQFVKTLGKLLNRPTLFPLPATIVRLRFGQMGQTLLLAGAKVLPEKLQSAGFQFQYPQLDQALQHLLGS